MKYELTGSIVNSTYLNFDPWGHPIVSLRLNEKLTTLQMFEELKDCENLTIKISKVKKKRSHDANAYAWVLISKIAAKTNVAVNEVYRTSNGSNQRRVKSTSISETAAIGSAFETRLTKRSRHLKKRYEQGRWS